MISLFFNEVVVRVSPTRTPSKLNKLCTTQKDHELCALSLLICQNTYECLICDLYNTTVDLLRPKSRVPGSNWFSVFELGHYLPACLQEVQLRTVKTSIFLTLML